MVLLWYDGISGLRNLPESIASRRKPRDPVMSLKNADTYGRRVASNLSTIMTAGRDEHLKERNGFRI